MKQKLSLYDLLLKVLAALERFWGECCDAESIVAASRAAVYQEQQRQLFQAEKQLEYNYMANALRNCLISNHKKCGLDYPTQLADVLCNDAEIAIGMDGNGQVVFRYETDRLDSKMYVGGMKKLPVPEVKTEIIAKKLSEVLKKFASCYNCSYQGPIDVCDIEDGRVRIEIYNPCWWGPQI